MTDRTAPKSGSDDKTGADEPKSAAAKSITFGRAETAANPYPNYDMMSLEELRKLAKERDVSINADVEKAHLVTELRAADSHG